MQTISFQSSLALPHLLSYYISLLFLAVKSIQIKYSFLSSRIKAGERTKPTQIRELSSPGQRGVFWVPAELTTPGAAVRRSAQIELTAVFFHKKYKVLTSIELCYVGLFA